MHVNGVNILGEGETVGIYFREILDEEGGVPVFWAGEREEMV
jgi:hypothetical protein